MTYLNNENIYISEIIILPYLFTSYVGEFFGKVYTTFVFILYVIYYQFNGYTIILSCTHILTVLQWDKCTITFL